MAKQSTHTHYHIKNAVDLSPVLTKLDQLATAVETLRTEVLNKMSVITDALDDLNAKVTAQETVEASAITLLQQLKTALDAALALNDPTATAEAIKQVSAKLGTDTQALADAVVANTPAAPGGPV